MSRWSEGEFEIYQQRRKAPVNLAPVKRPSPHAKPMYALGRLKTEQMNKTEARYAEHLERLKAAGEIAWYKFEGIKFRLADNTSYSPDFMVMLPGGEMQIHEIKGFAMDDSLVKIKVACELFPFRGFIIREKPKKIGGGWDIQEVGNKR